MTKLIKKLLFVSIDGMAQTVYNLRERHLLNLNERLDRLAGKFWNESESS